MLATLRGCETAWSTTSRRALTLRLRAQSINCESHRSPTKPQTLLVRSWDGRWRADEAWAVIITRAVGRDGDDRARAGRGGGEADCECPLLTSYTSLTASPNANARMMDEESTLCAKMVCEEETSINTQHTVCSEGTGWVCTCVLPRVR